MPVYASQPSLSNSSWRLHSANYKTSAFALISVRELEARRQEPEASRSSMPVGQSFRLQPAFQPAVAQSPEKPRYTCSLGKN